MADAFDHCRAIASLTIVLQAWREGGNDYTSRIDC